MSGYGKVTPTMAHQQVVFTQQSTTLQSSRPQVKPREKYKRILHGFGITEIVLGSLSCILAIVIIAEDASPLAQVGHGIWCGAFLLASGILGVLAKKKPTMCMYNANMAVSIVAANFLPVLVILAAIDAAVADDETGSALAAVLSIIGFIGFVVTIVHSAYCCAGVCCVQRSYRGAVIYMPQPYMQQPQQMVQLSNGQYMMAACPPIVPSNTATPNPMLYQNAGNFESPPRYSA